MYSLSVIHKTGTYVCLNNSVLLCVEVADFFMYGSDYYFNLLKPTGYVMHQQV